MTSLSSLHSGSAAKWRVALADDVLPTTDQHVWQQEWPNQPAIIHACTNLGAPFDDACHAKAYQVWSAVAKMRRPANRAAWDAAVDSIREAVF